MRRGPCIGRCDITMVLKTSCALIGVAGNEILIFLQTILVVTSDSRKSGSAPI